MQLLAEVAYGVSYFEWLILGDLPHLTGLPPELQIARLAGLTTGQIARALTNAATLAKVNESKLRDWLLASGRDLEAIGLKRNDVLHARPATIDGKQQLHRWAPPPHNSTFTITKEVLRDIVSDIDRCVSRAYARRLT